MQNTTIEQNPIILTFPEKFYTKKDYNDITK